MTTLLAAALAASLAAAPAAPAPAAPAAAASKAIGPAPASPSAPADPSGAAVDAAAAELVDVALSRETWARLLREMAGVAVRQVRADVEQRGGTVDAGMEPAIEGLFQEWLSYEFLTGEMVAIYAGAFTLDELTALTAFYRTPAGAKALAKMPELMRAGVEVGQRRMERAVTGDGKAAFEKLVIGHIHRPERRLAPAPEEAEPAKAVPPPEPIKG